MFDWDVYIWIKLELASAICAVGVFFGIRVF